MSSLPTERQQQMGKKGMLNRLPGKARGIKLKHQPSKGVPLVGHLAVGRPQVANLEADEVVPVSPDLFSGSDLFALRVRGDSMKHVGILPGDIAIMDRDRVVADGEIEAVLIEDDATLKYLYRRRASVLLRGANPQFPDIAVPAKGHDSVQIPGKFVGLVRTEGRTR